LSEKGNIKAAENDLGGHYLHCVELTASSPRQHETIIFCFPLVPERHMFRAFAAIVLWQDKVGFDVSQVVTWIIDFPQQQSHRIHGTGVFTYIWLIFMVNVGKYTSPMDPMGMKP